MNDEKRPGKKGDPLEELGSVFDDLKEEAEAELDAAAEELRSLQSPGGDDEEQPESGEGAESAEPPPDAGEPRAPAPKPSRTAERRGYELLAPGALGLREGAEGGSVRDLQAFLRRFGYLKSEDESDPYRKLRSSTEPSARAGALDAATAKALRAFQKYMGLAQTGMLDGPTAAALTLPRCGVPDSPYALRARLAGDAWPTRDLRYAVTNVTPDLPRAATLAAIREAFELWARVTPLTFTSVAVGANPEIVVSFVAGDHGDGTPFDGPGRTLAHAFYPPPNAPLAGDTHFDEAERWTVTLPIPPGTIDLVSVAVHEFGHALGLDHSPDRSAVMFAAYSGERRALALDDIRRIQAMYGQPEQPVPPGPAPPPVDPWNDPATRALIDEWIRQQNTCVKRKYPGAYVDRWGRLCGRLSGGIIDCSQTPDKPPDWDSYRYLWVQNWAPTYYSYTLYEYVSFRQAGRSYSELAVCRNV